MRPTPGPLLQLNCGPVQQELAFAKRFPTLSESFLLMDVSQGGLKKKITQLLRDFSERFEVNQAPNSHSPWCGRAHHQQACLSVTALGQMRLSVQLHGSDSERSSLQLETGTATAPLQHARRNHKEGLGLVGSSYQPHSYTHSERYSACVFLSSLRH